MSGRGHPNSGWWPRPDLHRQVSIDLGIPLPPWQGDLVQPAPRVPSGRARRAGQWLRAATVVALGLLLVPLTAALTAAEGRSPVGGTGNSPALTAPAPEAAPGPGT